MADDPTIGELFEAKVILGMDLVRAVDAYMADPATETFEIGGSYVLNLAGAVEASAYAQRVLVDPDANMMRRRGVVRAAILLARPEKR
ncbi:hypothetical protein [Methylobacterium iners]|jgi:hypothetical protein|uniref:Uncharacterized protein n=1 Tax=Methylobacterium iners TaxID=418707 RepID=A0ABQ4S2H4_9HYPH|nr:hypothetical protein [Methylobacterium iners]GJD97328.1 hypothetical protein OCOJLMKI_4557 [Methylobacterium iners]